MSRPLRIEYSGVWYHTMNHSRRGTESYVTRDDHELFLNFVVETVALFNLNVAAYCLMPNHYHLPVHTPDGNLSRCMRHLNGVYTQRYNIAIYFARYLRGDPLNTIRLEFNLTRYSSDSSVIERVNRKQNIGRTFRKKLQTIESFTSVPRKNEIYF